MYQGKFRVHAIVFKKICLIHHAKRYM